MSGTTLVILAAGLGSRFGGTKQLVAVGPDGSTIMDYTAFDAWRAGCRSVVLVIRDELRDVVRPLVTRIERRVDVRLAIQAPTSHVPAGAALGRRTKPWGTGHAVLCGVDGGAGPVVVANADDFYGPRALAAAFAAPSWALVTYALASTVPPTGAVARGLCTVSGSGALCGVGEQTGVALRAGAPGFTAADGTWTALPSDQPVSMNLWRFDADVRARLHQAWQRFFALHGRDLSAEFFLPAFVDGCMRAGVVVHAVPADDQWCGLTWRDDTAAVAQLVAGHVAAERYPRELWR